VEVEFNPAHIAHLSERFPEAVFIRRDLDQDTLCLDEGFDTILLIAIIEHIWNQKFLSNQLVVLSRKEAIKP
jgi:hypothetical protein